jgi:hypothetical protein
MKKSQVIFDANALKKVMMKNLTEEQTRRLVAYAENKIKEIGDKIQTYNSVNHMDRTGNLLNSLCWGVAYDGELKASGFYREASSIKESYLHEWGEYSKTFVVDGHAEAENYIQKYGKVGSGNGCWRVFFAILAPYWGYWEKGFTLIHGASYNREKYPEGKPKFRGATFKKFAVMTEFYDTISKELKPAKVNFHISKSIEYSPSYDWRGKTSGKKYHVAGTLERWNESGRYRSTRSKRR